jgi:hypothetical protein
VDDPTAFDLTRLFYAFGGLGMLLGAAVRQHGMRLRPDGLYLVPKDQTLGTAGSHAELLLSRDCGAVLGFLGLEDAAFPFERCAGLGTADLCRWAARSPYFDAATFPGAPRSCNNTTRYQKSQALFGAMHEALSEREGVVPLGTGTGAGEDKGGGEVGKGDQGDQVGKVDQGGKGDQGDQGDQGGKGDQGDQGLLLERACAAFPHVREEHARLRRDAEVRSRVRAAFNGRVVQGVLPHLSGAALGRFMADFKNSVGAFDEYVLGRDAQALNADIAAHVCAGPP